VHHRFLFRCLGPLQKAFVLHSNVSLAGRFSYSRLATFSFAANNVVEFLDNRLHFKGAHSNPRR